MAHKIKLIESPLEDFNRRKYHETYKQLEALDDSATLLIDVDDTRAEARRIRAALQGMAKYHGEFVLITSVSQLAANKWQIKIVKKLVAT